MDVQSPNSTARGYKRPLTHRMRNARHTGNQMALDQAKLEQFMGKAVGDLGATLNSALVVLGERLGLYKALAELKSASSPELAKRTECDERYVREWLAAQAAGGYVEYDAASKRYSMTEEQAFALANEGGPAYLPGAFQLALGVLRDEPKIRAAFRSGAGVGWHEHDQDLFEGTERFFRPGYVANLTSAWLPALDGVVAKLERGARVADVGCGHGASTIVMAQKYPQSRFFGFDYHGPSIEWARAQAKAAGVAERVTFEVASAKQFGGTGYDLVTFFDCLHDMGDPAGASKHVRDSMASDGTWMIVEPFAGDRVEDNLNPVGRVFYCASTLVCTPASRSQEVALCLGAQAGEAKLREV